MAAKQVLFGYRVNDIVDAIIDSGEPHLTTEADAIDAAKLMAKHRVSHAIEWTRDDDGGWLGSYVPARDAFPMYLTIEVTTREVPLA